MYKPPTLPAPPPEKKSLVQRFYEGNKAIYDGHRSLVDAILGKKGK